MLNFNIGTMQSDDWPAIRNMYAASGHLSGESFEHRDAQVLRISPSRITRETRATRQYLEGRSSAGTPKLECGYLNDVDKLRHRRGLLLLRGHPVDLFFQYLFGEADTVQDSLAVLDHRWMAA